MTTKQLKCLFISLFFVALTACGGGDDPAPTPTPTPTPTTGTISGTVSGTVIVAIDDTGNILATDNTAGKTPDASGNYPFTLVGIPVGTNVRVYLMTASGVYPMYFGTPNTNVFSLSAVATISLGFVDTTLVQGQAIPVNDPTALTEVNAGAVNTVTPTLPAGGTFIVHVTDENSGVPISGATVIVDHASDPRQIATTTTAGTVSFNIPNGGPVTVTVGKSGFELGTLLNTNIAFLNIPISPLGLSAVVQGTATPAGNYIGPAGIVSSLGVGDLNDACTGCENLYNGTPGFYRLNTTMPNRKFSLSAIDYGSGVGPINFTSVTGVGPLVDGETFTWDPVFPITPPATTITTGTITAPASLGTISEIVAIGLSDTSDQGVLVGVSVQGTSSPFPYSITSFAYTGGFSDDILAVATDTGGGETATIQRGVGFGGSSVDFNLIDLPTNLTPTGACGGVAPTFSWTAVSGISFYGIELTGMSSSWKIAMDANSTSLVLPDLTGTPIAALGLSPGVAVNWAVEAITAPGFDINTINFDEVQRTFISRSVSAGVSCTP